MIVGSFENSAQIVKSLLERVVGNSIGMLALKKFPGTNTLAYFVAASVTRVTRNMDRITQFFEK
jgi:hypothetical protein